MAATLKPTTPVLNTGDQFYPGLIMALPLSEGLGTTVSDISGNTHTGSLISGATWVTDAELGTVIQLDGTSGYVSLDTALNSIIAGMSSVTISMWVKLRNNVPSVATKTGLADLGGLTGSNAGSRWPNTGGTGDVAIFRSSSLGRVNGISLGVTNKALFHLVTITQQQGGSWKLYLNGSLLSTQTAENPTPASIAPKFGRSDDSAGPFFLDGWLGDIRIWSRELNSSEVLSLFNSPWTLYTVTVPIAQAKTEVLMVGASPFPDPSTRTEVLTVDTKPFMTADAAKTEILMVDSVQFTSPGVTAPPNNPGSLPINISNATDPRKKPDNDSPVPALNSDAVNTGIVLAFPLTEGGTTAPSSAPGVTAAAGGSVTVGTHQWVYSYILSNGDETGPSPVSTTLNIAGGTQTVNLTGITAGPAGTTARKVYRTLAGGAGTAVYFLVTTISDNTTTTFSDTVADGSLGVIGPQQVRDRSGSANNGAFGGNAAWDTSLASYNFRSLIRAPSVIFSTGTGANYIRVPDSTSLKPSTTVSVAAWVRPRGFPSASGIIAGKMRAGAYSYVLYISSSGVFRWQVTDTIDGANDIGGGSFTNAQQAAPFFVVGTYDGSLTNLYVNGALVASSGNSGTIQYTSPLDFVIGGDTLGNANVNSNVESVHVWSRAISQAEVTQLYGSGAGAATGAFQQYCTGSLDVTEVLTVDALTFPDPSVKTELLLVDASPTSAQAATRTEILMVDAVQPVANTAGLGFSSIDPIFGPITGGTFVTVRGVNFQNITSVLVGGVALTSLTVYNSGMLTGVTGAHTAGYVPVQINSSSLGTVLTPFNVFSYASGVGGNQLFVGKQFDPNIFNQEVFTGETASVGVDTTLSFTLAQKPVAPGLVELYIKHTADIGGSLQRQGATFNYTVDIANSKIIWKSTAPFGIVSTDEITVFYIGIN